jgi:hypothetical protein
MGDKLISGLVAILTAIIGIAIIAVLVSNKSQTPQVISAAGTAFSNVLKGATASIQ